MLCVLNVMKNFPIVKKKIGRGRCELLGELRKYGHKDGLSYNFNQLRVTFWFLCLKWFF